MTNDAKREIERLKERQNEPLLDAVNWSNVLVTELINPTRLEEKGNLIRSDKNPIKLRLEDGTDFCSLLIKDYNVGVFKAGALLQGNVMIPYGTLHTTVTGNILGNMIGNTAEETVDRLRNNLQALDDKYGVIVDTTGITIKKMEIQRTFELVYPYEQYQRVLKRIFSNFPPRSRFKNLIKFGGIQNEKITEQTFYTNSYRNKKSENYREIKVYDKSKEIQERIGIELERSWARLELTLIGTRTIENALGSKDLEIFAASAINDYFNNQMQELIIKPYHRWKTKRDKELLNLLKEQRVKDPKRWVNNSLTLILNREVDSGTPFVLGIDEILAVVDQLGLDRRTKSRVKKSFRLLGERTASVLMQGDDAKMQEFIDKLNVSKCLDAEGEKCDTQKVIECK